MNLTTDCASDMQKVFFTDTKNDTDSHDPSNTTLNISSKDVLELKPEEQPDFFQKVCAFATENILRSLLNITVNKYGVSNTPVWSANSTLGNCSSSR